MIPIKKYSEPRGLKNAKKANKDLDYENNAKTGFAQLEDYKDVFDELRTKLVSEQGGICCYCQKSIAFVSRDNCTMKTEHFKPKLVNGEHRHLQLHYDNLLAACEGNSEFGNTKQKTCDSAKGGKELKKLPNPASMRQESFDQFLKYKERNDGYIEVIAVNADPDIQHDIKLLNLNEQNLKIARYAKWKGIMTKIQKRDGSFDVKKLYELLESYKPTYTAMDRAYEPYCGCILSWFQARFRNELAAYQK